MNKELKTFVLINPVSSSGHGVKVWEKVEPRFLEAGVDCRVFLASSEEEMIKLTASVTLGDEEVNLIILGGDGTLNAVINSIGNPEKVTLGFIPIGSANDFARSLEIKNPFEAAGRILSQGSPVMRDLGVISWFPENENEQKKRYFLSACGIGFDAECCYLTDHTILKRAINFLKLGKFNYLVSAFRLFFTFKLFPAEVAVKSGDELILHRFKRAMFIVCGNHKFEGGGFQFTPDADGTDGVLDVCVIHDVGRITFLKMFNKCYDGSHVNSSFVSILRGERIRVNTDRAMHFHTDGETFEETKRVEVELRKKQVRWMY